MVASIFIGAGRAQKEGTWETATLGLVFDMLASCVPHDNNLFLPLLACGSTTCFHYGGSDVASSSPPL